MILVNGEQTDSIPVHDRGLHYGDGVFETIAVRDGQPLRWPRHLRRLRAGCERLGIPAPHEELLAGEVRHVCAAEQRAVLKLIVTRGTGTRGYAPPAEPSPTRIVAGYPWPPHAGESKEQGVTVRLCASRLSENAALAGIKHLNRLENVLARREWDDPAIAEGLMRDTHGRAVGGTMSNIFMVQGDSVITPELSRCGVAGIMREVILELAPTLDLGASVRDVTFRELRDADELFLCNAIIGVWPVRRLEQWDFPVGTVTRRIAEAVKEAE